jgi:hypothetical protein
MAGRQTDAYPMNLALLLDTLRSHPAVQEKMVIERPYALTDPSQPVRIGDDCAAICDGNGGYTLFASEGMLPAFVNRDPWFAGYSAIMVNISDICSMGGLPTAVTNVIWGQHEAATRPVWEGMLAASRAYGVPIVGGHTSYHNPSLMLAVSIIGKARRLLTSFDAKPGQQLLMAIDLDGAYVGENPFWNASTNKQPDTLQRTLRIPSEIAEAGLSGVAKDISNGGIIGTLAMLAQTSAVGAVLDLAELPMPPGVPLAKWLTSFPSYGYLLTADAGQVKPIRNCFTRQGISCQVIGEITAGRDILIRHGHDVLPLNAPAYAE